MGFNIKDHIEAGHYPKDEKGRALVPMSGGGVFTVCATDKPQTKAAANEGAKPRCIVGWTPGYYLESFPADDAALLPPPPRKVAVTPREAFVDADGLVRALREAHHRPEDFPNWRVVTLTGEYEVPWS